MHIIKEVKHALVGENSREKATVPRGNYNSYMPEESAQVGKYALKNGNTQAVRYFTKFLDCKTRLKVEYMYVCVNVEREEE